MFALSFMQTSYEIKRPGDAEQYVAPLPAKAPGTRVVRHVVRVRSRDLAALLMAEPVEQLAELRCVASVLHRGKGLDSVSPTTLREATEQLSALTSRRGSCSEINMLSLRMRRQTTCNSTRAEAARAGHAIHWLPGRTTRVSTHKGSTLSPDSTFPPTVPTCDEDEQ